MKSKIFAHWGLFVLLLVVGVFNYQVLLKGFMPAPMDGMIGLYNPFRDLYASEYPNGIPFKNFLLTDPFRQLIVWKDLTIDIFKTGNIPLWNPYEMGGKPLLGNFQSGALYPLNIIFFLFPFKLAWSMYIISAQIIGGVCMYMYLGYLRKGEFIKTLGSLVFVFSGFFIAWYEWGNVGHAYAWFPLALLSIERLANVKEKNTRSKLLSGAILGGVFSLSFLAGHPQTTLYFMFFSTLYLITVVRVKIKTKIQFYSSSIITFLILSSVQIYQGLYFIRYSLRGDDQVFSSVEGWFVPYQNLIQFFAPDFFGNPSTLNYWGIFNYAEFIGYIGVPLLVLSIASFLAEKDRRFYFALTMIVLSLVFGTNNIISNIPYNLSIPILSSMQPTRLIGFASLGILFMSLIGFEALQNKISLKKMLLISGSVLVLILMLWGSVVFNSFGIEMTNLETTKRNLILPSLLFLTSIAILVSFIMVRNNRFARFKKGLFVILLVIVILDLLRFANKFTPFSDGIYFYPPTSIIAFIQKNIGSQRIMSIDDRILAPNITTQYKIQNLGGYDPLYLKNFAEMIVASERQSDDVGLPYGFNRIISPKNIESKIIDLLGVKYVLSIGDITSEKFKLVATEGSTKLYENIEAKERAFFVSEVKVVSGQDESIRSILDLDLEKTAVVRELGDLEFGTDRKFAKGVVRSYEVTQNGSKIKTQNKGEGFLVVTDSYYPLIRAYVDGVETVVYETDHALRGIIVPSGSRVVEFKTALFK